MFLFEIVFNDMLLPSKGGGRHLGFFRRKAILVSTAILLPFAESFKKDCCQLQAKVCA